MFGLTDLDYESGGWTVPTDCRCVSPPDGPRSVWVNVSSEVMEGSSVTLHCEVDSNPAARISWMFGDQELLWDTAANVSLSLDDMSAAQEGVYTCVGDNGYGAMNASLYLSIKCKSQTTLPTGSRSNHSSSSRRAQVLRYPEHSLKKSAIE